MTTSQYFQFHIPKQRIFKFIEIKFGTMAYRVLIITYNVFNDSHSIKSLYISVLTCVYLYTYKKVVI